MTSRRVIALALWFLALHGIDESGRELICPAALFRIDDRLR